MQTSTSVVLAGWLHPLQELNPSRVQRADDRRFPNLRHRAERDLHLPRLAMRLPDIGFTGSGIHKDVSHTRPMYTYQISWAP